MFSIAIRISEACPLSPKATFGIVNRSDSVFQATVRKETVPFMSKRETSYSEIQVASGIQLPYTLGNEVFRCSSQFEIMVTEPNLNPPYVAYRTFRTFLESLAISMPDRIDRSVFDSRFSGTATSQINSALRSLKLIDAEGNPNEALKLLARTEGEQHHKVLEQILRSYYLPVFRLDLERATKAQFREAMREFGCTDSMLVKCETFFIHAARHAGIPLSPYLKSNRKANPRSRSNSRSSKSGSRPQTMEENGRSPTPESTGVDSATITMRELAIRVLDKYPDFDPKWSEETQTSWLEGMNKLQETFNVRNQPAS